MRIGSFATFGVLALLTAASAFGQQKARFDVPFEFRFLDTVMPAGQYDVKVAGNAGNMLSLECYANRAHAHTMTYGISGSGNVPDEPRLVFNKYGDTYFLSEVWTTEQSQGAGLSKSKAEREVARTIPTVERVILASGTRQAVVSER